MDWFAGRARVRIVTPEGEVRQSFDDEAEALRFRDTVRATHPDTLAHGFRSSPMHTKSSDLPPGVSRVERSDGSITYQAAWKDATGKRRVTGFRAGLVDEVSRRDERRARETAIAFRKAWEHAVMTRTAFDRYAFRHWREIELFPFVPVAAPVPARAEASDDHQPDALNAEILRRLAPRAK